MNLLWCFFLTGLLGFAYPTGNGLKWVRVNVPQFRVPGEIAQLQCDYDLGNDTLYSVKWYKEHEEFYRYVPKSRPQSISYRVEGVHVDMSKSDSRKVVLHSVNWKTSGSYKCEVSAEAPSFASAQSEARMEVVCKYMKCLPSNRMLEMCPDVGFLIRCCVECDSIVHLKIVATYELRRRRFETLGSEKVYYHT